MLTLCLEISEDIEKFPQPDRTSDCDLEEEYIDALIMDLCKIFDESGLFQFKVEFKDGGFGLDSWPVDVWVDLSTVIEQVTDVIDSIRKERYPVNLDFYEQGLERRLIFAKDDNDSLLRVTCESWGSWTPDPTTLLVNKDDILSQLVTLKSSFVRAAKTLCPGLSEIDFFTKWCEI